MTLFDVGIFCMIVFLSSPVWIVALTCIGEHLLSLKKRDIKFKIWN